MPYRVHVLNPLECPEWDNLVLNYNDSTFFHTAAWAKVLQESYGYAPTYFTITNDPGQQALIPLLEINSFLTGRRGVSLAFTDCCDPLVTDGMPFSQIISELIEYGKCAKWKYLELRISRPLPVDIPASVQFYGHTLDISGEEKAILSKFRDSTRRNITKAEKKGVEVTINRSRDALREFHRLNCATRREHGLPCQPYAFFENIYSHIISRNLGVVALAAKDGKNIAGALFLHFNDRAIYKYGASDRNYQQFRSNNLLFWKAIQWYQGHGFKRLDFGRTESENTGLLQFKRGWGATEHSINFCRYDFRRKIFVTDHAKVTGWYNRIFRRMPISLLKLAGAVLYRHVG